MARKTYVQIDGKLYDKDELSRSEAIAPSVLPDMPEFRSPIDGKVYSGRSGLRDHCARHNVVPTAELKGLPPKPAYHTLEHTPEQRQQTRRVIADVINSRSDLWRHFKG
jgi:hypothetical protein